jgi:hypothetical protein
MKTNEILEQLIQGSRNIDRMRDIVNQVVKQVIGCVNANYNGEKRHFHELFNSKTCQWVIYTEHPNDTEKEFELKAACWVKDEYGGISHTGYVGCHSERDSHAPAWMIQPTFESLDVFIEAILKLFPELHKYWKPIIDASHAKVSD